jgi:membrane protein DedA with SNARE-associated domain
VAHIGGLEHLVHEYGYAAVAGGILLENFGLPLPGELLLISGALAAAEGALHIAPLLVLAWAAAVVGNGIGWAIGYYGGHRLLVRYGARLGITAARLQRVEAAFDRWGDYAVVFARFVVVLRQLSGIVAGMLAMRWQRFILLSAAGAALWVLWWGLATYFFGTRVLQYLRSAGRIEPLLLAVAALTLFGVALRLRWKRRR